MLFPLVLLRSFCFVRQRGSQKERKKKAVSNITIPAKVIAKPTKKGIARNPLSNR